MKNKKEVKERVSVRVLPSRYKQAVKQFGSFTNFINAALEKMVKKED